MSKVDPIPAGMHSVTPHLVCRDAHAAIDFYVKAFGAEDGGRMNTPDGKLMHGIILIGDSHVMLVEEFPEYGGASPLALGNTPVTLHVYFKDVNAAWDRAVAAGAKVKMPLADMFWGDRYGIVEDPFGHHWSLAQHIKDMTPEEMQEAMKSMPPC